MQPRHSLTIKRAGDDSKPYVETSGNLEEQISPKSAEQIRRIHELVALYRCRFKANASDAAVMGTLHSAASVIQIHFRYLKHLKEAGLQNSLLRGKKRDQKHPLDHE